MIKLANIIDKLLPKTEVAITYEARRLWDDEGDAFWMIFGHTDEREFCHHPYFEGLSDQDDVEARLGKLILTQSTMRFSPREIRMLEGRF